MPSLHIPQAAFAALSWSAIYDYEWFVCCCCAYMSIASSQQKLSGVHARLLCICQLLVPSKSYLVFMRGLEQGKSQVVLLQVVIAAA